MAQLEEGTLKMRALANRSSQNWKSMPKNLIGGSVPKAGPDDIGARGMS